MGAFRSNLDAVREIDAARSPGPRAPRIAIVGGGASGSLMALALARLRTDVRVTLIEPSARAGRGLAYGTPRPEHRMNVLPRRLSAFTDRPDDFADWLVDRGVISSIADKSFVPRALMGEYLGDRLAQVGHRVEVLRTEVTGIVEGAETVHLALASGDRLDADAAVLATGHSWAPPRDRNRDVPADAPVVIIGTGLTMVDRWLSLREAGHRGVITAVSRHGLSPLDHGDCPPPLALASMPLGRPVSETMRWLRQLAARTPDWRSAVDAIRPRTQALWQSWSIAERRRFLRHARRYWDVHRHRLAPDIGTRLVAEIANGTLRIERARELPRGAHVFDCRGRFPERDALRSPLIAGLVAAGTARLDDLGIGLDVTADCRLVGRTGAATSRLFAVGPITRSRFWEIEAIPDIRVQCSELSAVLATSWGRGVLPA